MPETTEPDLTEADVTQGRTPDEQDAARPKVLLIGVLALLLVALLVIAVVSGLRWRSAEEKADREQAALTAARTATVAVLSYDYRTLDADIARARGMLTPSYAEQYEQAAGGIEDGARKSQASVRASVRTASVITSTASQVSALLYVDQVRSGTQLDNGSLLDQSAIRVTMRSVDGRWLVNDLTPLG